MKDIISDIAVIVKEQQGSIEEMYKEMLNGKSYTTYLITDWKGNGIDLKLNLDDKKFMLKKVNINEIEQMLLDTETLLGVLFYLINSVRFEWVTEEDKWKE